MGRRSGGMARALAASRSRRAEPDAHPCWRRARACPADPARRTSKRSAGTREPRLAGDDLVARVSDDLARLAKKGVDVVGVRSSLVCTKRLNDERSRGRSRFDVDLHAMERIVLDTRERVVGDLEVVCGKVGGYARYSDAFGPLGGRLHAIIEEGAKRSAYSFPGLGIISFVRDADASHLLVAMASMVGKWIREVMMSRIVRFYGHHENEALDASGYHDPVTDRFVAATALVRKKKDIPGACFERVGEAGGERAIST